MALFERSVLYTSLKLEYCAAEKDERCPGCEGCELAKERVEQLEEQDLSEYMLVQLAQSRGLTSA